MQRYAIFSLTLQMQEVACFLISENKPKKPRAMKVHRILIGLLAAGVLATGCTKEYYTEQYTIVEGLDMTLIDFNVRSNDWSVWNVENGNDDEGYFQATLAVPEITKDVVEKGVVIVHRRYEDGVSTPLPAMRTEKTEDGLYYTTFVDYEWAQGVINIFVTATDLYAGTNPGDMSFRVAIQL